MSQIQQFYIGQNIFITGGTGFLGRILIEKLLRSCPEIGTIYLLIRAKKGKSAKERVDALLVDTIFDVLRSDYPDFSNKIVGVLGDVSEEGLGLSDADHARLVNEVSVIFHLAATVRFNEGLDSAVAINVNGVKSIVDIAKACENLKVAIYVSTAYSHCVQKSITEELYPSPLSYEGINKLVKDAGKNEWSEDEVDDFTKRVLGEWPNTYSFTKAIAEGVLAEFAKGIPFAVFRPSIVVSTYSEPIPGWLPSPIGLPGFMCATGLGILHVGLSDVNARVDIVPVDYVCNALIACAWETAMTDQWSHEDIQVYNYVSGNENPITWKQFLGKSFVYSHIFPFNRTVYYPFLIRTKSSRLFTVLNFLLHLVPALIIDNVARLFGKKLGLYKVVNKIGNAQHAVGYFATQQWDFEGKRVQNLWQRIGPEDKRAFPFRMQNVDWDEHVMRMMRGLRKYIVGDPDGMERKARKRQFYLYIIHTAVRLAFGIFILWTTWKMICGCGFSAAWVPFSSMK